MRLWQIFVATFSFPRFQYEFAGYPRHNFRLLKTDHDILGINIGAVIRHGEIRSSEYVYKRQFATSVVP